MSIKGFIFKSSQNAKSDLFIIVTGILKARKQRKRKLIGQLFFID